MERTVTRAQMEAARGRVAGVLDEWLGTGKRDMLCGRLVAAVLGHPDGKAPKAARARKPGRGTRTRSAR